MRKRRQLEESGNYLKAEKKHLSSFPLYSKKRGKVGVPEFFRACLHGGGGPQVEVTRLGVVTRLSIQSLIL